MAIAELVKALTPANFAENRAQLWAREDPVEIREWIKLSMDNSSKVHQLYYVCLQDLDADLGRAASYVARLKERPDCLFGLTGMWRFALRNYAFRSAFQVSAALKEAGESRWLRFWRWKDVLMWRLAISIMAGFLVLSSSSLLVEILTRAQGSCGWLITAPTLAVAALFLHVFADTFRRVTKRGWRIVVGRATIVTALGIFYAALGGTAIYYAGQNLKMNPQATLAMLCAAAALLLGFVFYLFWQDRSVGDPL